jgi:hypothetical protein
MTRMVRGMRSHPAARQPCYSSSHLGPEREGGEGLLEEEPFRLEEATIDELHEAIKAGQTTCVAILQCYIDRARAYNGVCSLLVTEEGAPVPEATGAVRATAPLRFPTETVRASTILPDLAKYQGPPLEFGRMESTASDEQPVARGLHQPAVMLSNFHHLGADRP